MLERSFVNLGGLPPVRLSIGHRSCAYFGHCNRKCSGVSLGSPQAGHRGLSTLPRPDVGAVGTSLWVFASRSFAVC